MEPQQMLVSMWCTQTVLFDTGHDAEGRSGRNQGRDDGGTDRPARPPWAVTGTVRGGLRRVCSDGEGDQRSMADPSEWVLDPYYYFSF